MEDKTFDSRRDFSLFYMDKYNIGLLGTIYLNLGAYGSKHYKCPPETNICQPQEGFLINNLKIPL